MAVKITILGTGTMGTGVAHALLRSGFPVTVWNRTPERARPLASAGATLADTPEEAVHDADVVLSILFDAASVLNVLHEAAPAVPEHAVWMQCSTIGVDGTRDVAAEAERLGVTLVETMMLGTKAPAEAGSLVMLTAGAAGPLATVQPVLDAMGSRTVSVGTVLGDASRLKIAVNAWIGTITAGTAQSLALAASFGIDPSLFLAAIAGSATDSAYAQLKGKAMLAGDFSTSFGVDGLVKDLRLAQTAATETAQAGHAVDQRLLASLISLYSTVGEAGHDHDDIAAVYTALSA